ncbi:hypothetical protein CASFOL_014301 [Castilleja foliolosa]|uniref:GDSL esterase/lipase n=1 Tax=Castilleja foliolosa TaxID=1961234 RepID=A0ABD3DP79_9LAMI
MWSSSPSGWFSPALVQFLLHFLLLVFPYSAQTRNSALQSQVNGSIPAVFVFGDSTVDSGNNNYIKTIIKSNFPPYGKDFPNHIPTGRFTNGKLATDFLVSYVGIKDYIPPYLDPTLSLDELKTGVCFASAATGFDPLTAQISDGVIPIQKQLRYFKEYKSRMEVYIGKDKTKSLISESVFIISAGTNDFILNYYGPPIRSQAYTISTYQDFILQLVQQFIQGILKLGARKIAVMGLPPIGCVPGVITLYSNNALTHRGCIDWLSSVARDYNRLLQNKLTGMQTHGTKIIYGDIYKPIEDMVNKPQLYGELIVVPFLTLLFT